MNVSEGWSYHGNLSHEAMETAVHGICTTWIWSPKKRAFVEQSVVLGSCSWYIFRGLFRLTPSVSVVQIMDVIFLFAKFVAPFYLTAGNRSLPCRIDHHSKSPKARCLFGAQPNRF